MTTRTYEQGARAEEAERTRMRIIEAVFTRLREAPAEPVAIDRIAKTAGVARSTVYTIFGSRAGLFAAVGQELAERSGYADLLQAKEKEDAREHLRHGARAGARMLAANRDLYRALHSMAGLDEEAVGDAVRNQEEERAFGMKRVVGRLAEQGFLREDISVEEAEQVLWVLTSFETFDALYTGRKMTVDQVADRLIEVSERALSAEPYR